MFQADDTGDFHKVCASDKRVVTAVQLAYDKYTQVIEGIMEDLLRLGEVDKAESQIIEQEGTLFKIDFGIVYIPAENELDCVALVLENLAEEFEVKNVVCDCCQEKDAPNNTVMNSEYIIAIKACFYYQRASLDFNIKQYSHF